MGNTPSGHLSAFSSATACSPTRRALSIQQLELLDQFVSFVLKLPAERVGIRALHDLVSAKGIGREAGAGHGARLMDRGALAGVKPLLVAAEIQIGLGQRNALHRAQLAVDLHQQVEILLDRGRERVDAARGRPLGLVRLFRSQLHAALL